MDLIILFCILFIGSLLFWECSKTILIKTVEYLANKGDPPTSAPPKAIEPLQYTLTETGTIQFKINELIVNFNKSQKLSTDFKQSTSDDPKQKASKVKPIQFKELDLSTINGTENELIAIQSKLNKMIIIIGALSPGANTGLVNILNKTTSPKKINAIKFKLNSLIYAFNIYNTKIYNDINIITNKQKEKANKSKAAAHKSNEDNHATNTFFNNR